MRRMPAFALVMSLFGLASVRADLALPKDQAYFDPRVSFEGLDQIPDHVFFLRYLTFTGSPVGVPHTLVPVKDATPFALKSQRRLFDLSLLAMDRKEFEKRSKEDPSLKWLTDKTDGVRKAEVITPNNVGPASQKEAPVTVYDVKLKDGKLTAAMQKPRKSSDAGPSGLLPLWAIGLLGCVGLTWAGLWVTRRKELS